MPPPTLFLPRWPIWLDDSPLLCDSKFIARFVATDVLHHQARFADIDVHHSIASANALHCPRCGAFSPQGAWRFTSRTSRASSVTLSIASSHANADWEGWSFSLPHFLYPPPYHSVPRYLSWPSRLLLYWRGALDLDLARESCSDPVRSCSLLRVPRYLPSLRFVDTSPAFPRPSRLWISAVSAHPPASNRSCRVRMTSYVSTDRARAPQVNTSLHWSLYLLQYFPRLSPPPSGLRLGRVLRRRDRIPIGVQSVGLTVELPSTTHGLTSARTCTGGFLRPTLLGHPGPTEATRGVVFCWTALVDLHFIVVHPRISLP